VVFAHSSAGSVPPTTNFSVSLKNGAPGSSSAVRSRQAGANISCVVRPSRIVSLAAVISARVSPIRGSKPNSIVQVGLSKTPSMEMNSWAAMMAMGGSFLRGGRHPNHERDRRRTTPAANSSKGGGPMADRVTVNEVGDVVLDDAGQLRALADEGRLAVFTRLQRHGPADAAGLASGLDRDLDTVVAALDTLAGAGLVELHDERWEAPGRGLFLQLPDGDPEAARAARELSGVMLLAVEHLPREWVQHVEPQLDDAWAGAAGLFNARLALTAEELNRVQEDLEELLLPYLNRSEADRPDSARQVRVLSYFLPEGPAD
jgi:hypothetical protein